MPAETVDRFAIPFLADENMSRGVLQILEDRGHRIYLARNEVGGGANDRLLAGWANSHLAVVLTFDTDFRQLIRRKPGERIRYPYAGRLLLRCSPVRAVERLTTHIERIEADYEVIVSAPDPRLIVEITDTQYRLEL